MRMGLRRSQRLRKRSEFDAAKTSSQRREGGPFLVQIRLFQDDQRPPIRRLGVIATKRLGSAVRRNRAKRRLREIFRAHQGCLPLNCDVVMVARHSLLTMPFGDCVERFVKTVARFNASRRPWKPPEERDSSTKAEEETSK